MTSLTFYGGVNEIGGNKILLEDKGVRLFFDFGESFTIAEGYAFEYLKPRKRLGLLDYFEFDFLPKIEGIYSKHMLGHTDFGYVKPKIDGVFISHCHSDHINHICFLDPLIPIYVGHGTKVIMDTTEEIGRQYTDYGKEGHNYKLFKTGDRIKINHLTIEPFHVDHSIPAAYGFIIHTSKGSIIYTGDLRMHGPAGFMTEDFIKKAAESKPIAVISEGTRINSEGYNNREEDVEREATGIINDAENIVFADMASRNLDRIMAFYRAAIANKRKLVIDTRTARLMDCLKEKMGLPDVKKDKNILVYMRQLRGCTYNKKDYLPWERGYLKKGVTASWINKNQDKVVMAFNIYRFFELVSIKPKKNSDYIYSMSEHFLEGPDNREALEVRKNWLEHFKFKMPEKLGAFIEYEDGKKEPVPMYALHASGHMPKEDIEKMIKKLGPDIVIPVHTDDHSAFRRFHNKVVLPEIEKKILL